MKAKAQRLGGSDRPLEKVDSSSWSPAELLNADVKTGLRPLSRRAYKSGGKVKGEETKARADRPKRKSGGSALTADSLINRNVKSANAEREGAGKHVGGFKKGGRAEKCEGGSMKKRGKYATDGSVPTPPEMPDDVRRSRELEAMQSRDPYEMTPAQQERARKLGTPRTYSPDQRKHGGRAKKFMGGPMMQPGGMLAGAAPAGPSGMPAGAMPPQVDPRLGIVPKNAMNFGVGASGSPYKKGGAVKHSDEAADKALIKKMVKPSARTGKSGGGKTEKDSLSPVGQKQRRLDELKKQMLRTDPKVTSKGDWGDMQAERDRLEYDLSQVYKPIRDTRAEGGKVFSGKGYPFKVPGADGGRTAHAAGGRTGKGKTNINIIVAAGKGQQPGMPPAGGMMPPPSAPGGRPVMMPPPPPGGAGAGAPPMPMPIPMPMPMGGAPAGGPAPMPRKAGGRISKVAHSYKDMEAGAGSGEGRLQKADIAKRSMHNKGGKVGHRSYSSYKDMDAGSGGGLGRLEKTEIARKGTGIQKA
jgi:hypothetical protein